MRGVSAAGGDFAGVVLGEELSLILPQLTCDVCGKPEPAPDGRTCGCWLRRNDPGDFAIACWRCDRWIGDCECRSGDLGDLEPRAFLNQDDPESF